MTTTPSETALDPASLMDLFAQRASEGDVAALLDLYEPDAVFEPEFGVVLAGHDQIRPGLEEFMKLKPTIVYPSEPDVVISGDVALVSTFWTMSGTAPDGSAMAQGGTSADVVRRQADGGWKILIDQPRGVGIEP